MWDGHNLSPEPIPDQSTFLLLFGAGTVRSGAVVCVCRGKGGIVDRCVGRCCAICSVGSGRGSLGVVRRLANSQVRVGSRVCGRSRMCAKRVCARRVSARNQVGANSRVCAVCWAGGSQIGNAFICSGGLGDCCGSCRDRLSRKTLTTTFVAPQVLKKLVPRVKQRGTESAGPASR